ncbi:MAG: NAD(P)-dependent alcohol dehydrogenase [Acidobacteriaceae bacterium]
MTKINGYATHAAGAELLPFKYEAGELQPNEVEIDITHCGICRSDLHLIDNDWGLTKYPFVPGHEIVGTIAAMGGQVKDRSTGQRVAVGWQADSCGTCEWCMRGDENLCAQSQGTCVHHHGGFAEKVRVNARFAIPVPEALASENTAPLMCAGITVYNPIRSAGIFPGSRVAVIGIGGLGHLALQFAHVFGAEVTAVSTSLDKEPEAKSLGAHHFVNSRDNGAMKKLAGSFDLVLSTVPQDQDWNTLVAALRPRGTLWLVGVPPSPLSAQVFPLIAGQRSIAASPSGGPHMLQEMLAVAARHDVKAITEPFPMAKANDAIAKLKKNQIRYRAVLGN